MEDFERETQTAITLTQIGFTDHEQKAEQLSGGWQRLSLARELVHSPICCFSMNRRIISIFPALSGSNVCCALRFGYLVATHDRTFLRASPMR